MAAAWVSPNKTGAGACSRVELALLAPVNRVPGSSRALKAAKSFDIRTGFDVLLIALRINE